MRIFVGVSGSLWKRASSAKGIYLLTSALQLPIRTVKSGWEQVLGYVQANIDFTENYLKEHVPGIGMIRPQASYLVFLDCRALGLPQEKLARLFAEKAHLP